MAITRKEIDEALQMICGKCENFSNGGDGPNARSLCECPVPQWAVGYTCVRVDQRYVCPFDDASKCEAFKRKGV